MKYFLATCLVCMLPCIAHADVQITEVAWMGTAASQYSEWFELYNDGDEEVNLAGWKVYEGDGGTLVFTLSKTISAQGYLLVERTTASAPDAVEGINDESGSFGGGGFANTGEHLVLKDDSGAIADELDFLDGWPAGDATTKETMQLQGTKWVTASPTPKDGVGQVRDDVDEEEAMAIVEKDPPLPKISPNAQQVQFTVPATIYRGTNYTFSAQPVLEYNFRATEGAVYWNMGDGTVIRQNKIEPISHTYAYPGTYTISYSYVDTYVKHEKLTGTKKIKVVEPLLTVAMVGSTAIELHNTSAASIDISGWKVVVDGAYLSIPDMTIVAEKARVTIPLVALGMTHASEARLIDPSGALVAKTGEDKNSSTVAREQTVELFEESSFVGSDDLVAQAASVETTETSPTPIRNRTKTIIFGAVALFVIGLSILLERIMARREYQ